MGVNSPQCGQVKPLMFSITPAMCMPSWLQKVMDLLTSSVATCCGVVTRMASALGMSWQMESGSSPVPGGQSTMR